MLWHRSCFFTLSDFEFHLWGQVRQVGICNKSASLVFYLIIVRVISASAGRCLGQRRRRVALIFMTLATRGKERAGGERASGRQPAA